MPRRRDCPLLCVGGCYLVPALDDLILRSACGRLWYRLRAKVLEALAGAEAVMLSGHPLQGCMGTPVGFAHEASMEARRAIVARRWVLMKHPVVDEVGGHVRGHGHVYSYTYT